jgi:adenylate cyclase
MVNFKFTYSPQAASAPMEEMCVVFTDIIDSTALWEFNEAIAHASVQKHHQIVRHELLRYGGYEVKVMGDGFMIVFETAQNALLFSLSVHIALGDIVWPVQISALREQLIDDRIPNAKNSVSRGLMVRIGIDFGLAYRSEPDPITGRMDYYGRMLNKAARIQSEAEGEEIAVSDNFVAKLYQNRCSQVIPELELDDMKRAQILHGDCPRALFMVVPKGRRSLKGIMKAHYVTLIRLIPQCI